MGKKLQNKIKKLNSKQLDPLRQSVVTDSLPTVMRVLEEESTSS
jgi:hypothetical protein